MFDMDSENGTNKMDSIFSVHKIALIVVSVFFILFIAQLYSSKGEDGWISAKEVAKEKAPPMFSPSLLSWSLATSSAEWKSRDSAASFIFQNKMWIAGGLNGNKEVNSEHFIEYWQAPHFNDIWQSEDGVTWERVVKEAEWLPRRSMSIVEFQGKLWMFGGWSPIAGYTNDVWQSDDGIAWRQVVSDAKWPAREGQMVEIFQDKIWMIGGVNYDERETKNDVWYSVDGINWQEATSTIPWSPRWDHATVVFKNKIFLTGGMNLSDDTFKDVWVTHDGFHWELVTDDPPWESRQGHLLVVFENRIWSIGRLNDEESGGVNDVWYSRNGSLWKKTRNNPKWLGREDHSVLVFKNNIYVFAGMDSNWEWRNDVWVSKSAYR